MKLLLVGPRWVGEWTEGMERAAKALGHTPSVFYYRSDIFAGLQSRAERRFPLALHKVLGVAARTSKRFRDLVMNRRLVAAARAFRPDVIVILKGETIARESLESLRALKTSLVSWWVDDPFKFPELVRHFELFDRLYMFDRDCMSRLEAQGLQRLVYLPCACDPTTFQPLSLDPSAFPMFKCTIGYVAVYHPTRAALLSQMTGWEVGLWGGGWEAAPELQLLPPGTWRGKQILPVEAAKVYNLAQICPNAHHPQTRIGGLNTRTFEVPAAGGFELADHVPGIEESFEVGREMITYSSPAHFRELTEYYLAHPLERAAVAERGRARVMRDHTYEQRLATILRTSHPT